MIMRDLKHWIRFGAVAAVSAALTVAALNAGAAQAADISPGSLKFAMGVNQAAGYETVPASYIVANPTSVFSDHFFYGARVTGELKRGDRVEALAKVKGYDWVLVGRDGTGIGYVSISMLSPADRYVP